MERQDDRTAEQLETHTLLVVGTDRFLSDWGKASGGASYAAWACTYDDVDTVERWVRRRGDQQRVRIATDPYRPRGCVHLHIYVVADDHPALRNGA